MEYETKKYIIKIKSIINKIIELLENNLQNFEVNKLDENQQEFLEFVIGKKENLVSIISKLTNILLKIQPFDDNNSKEIKLNNIDIDIINEFLKNIQINEKKC